MGPKLACWIFAGCVAGLFAAAASPDRGTVWAGQPSCSPTLADAEGPFFVPGAPERSVIGRGLVVTGTIRSTGSCAPIPGARLEWWQANPRGEYDNAHRATQMADADGRYRFETTPPGVYPGRPPHLHVKISSPGHRTLTTQ
jgi:protocatechuate 3,4-dioxygenase beta subunit